MRNFSAFTRSHKSIRHKIELSNRRFDVKLLPVDLQRVYGHLEKDFGEEYALTWVFMVRTAVELHRAWHMTLLTSQILQQIKDKYKIRTTWELGVIKLKFRVEDGRYELHRKVPYDYDSEFQDLYMKIATAYVEGHISVHEALIFQRETKHGLHTAKSGLFLRDYPGRLVLYPFEAATCCVIFFGGDWFDAGVAAVTGIASGLVEYALVSIGGEAKVLIDVLVGISTGAIGGLFYRFMGQRTCLPAIFLGTLYWFFYGTAFVIGILEIVAGMLETGVIRFMAVSVKTFVLSLGTAIGLLIVVDNSLNAWLDQDGNCNNINLDEVWWRIPLYLLCSASALGQYRFPIVHYGRGLFVQLVGYEVQYQAFAWFIRWHDQDFGDTAAANILGAMAAVVAACITSTLADKLTYYYNARLLHRNKEKYSSFGNFMFMLASSYVRFSNLIGLGRKNDLTFLQMRRKLDKQTEELQDPNHPRSEVKLEPAEEQVLTEAIVGAEPLNVWALLMPTVYQLVPGSIIARLWFNAIFPPPLLQSRAVIPGTDYTYIQIHPDVMQEAVFQNLMVIATSLALGLLLGLGLVRSLVSLYRKIVRPCKNVRATDSKQDLMKRQMNREKICEQDDDPSDNFEFDSAEHEASDNFDAAGLKSHDADEENDGNGILNNILKPMEEAEG